MADVPADETKITKQSLLDSGWTIDEEQRKGGKTPQHKDKPVDPFGGRPRN